MGLVSPSASDRQWEIGTKPAMLFFGHGWLLTTRGRRKATKDHDRRGRIQWPP